MANQRIVAALACRSWLTGYNPLIVFRPLMGETRGKWLICLDRRWAIRTDSFNCYLCPWWKHGPPSPVPFLPPPSPLPLLFLITEARHNQGREGGGRLLGEPQLMRFPEEHFLTSERCRFPPSPPRVFLSLFFDFLCGPHLV
jgi:hypothetical protein